jgi:hypothetical protein
MNRIEKAKTLAKYYENFILRRTIVAGAGLQYLPNFKIENIAHLEVLDTGVVQIDCIDEGKSVILDLFPDYQISDSILLDEKLNENSQMYLRMYFG